MTGNGKTSKRASTSRSKLHKAAEELEGRAEIEAMGEAAAKEAKALFKKGRG